MQAASILQCYDNVLTTSRVMLFTFESSSNIQTEGGHCTLSDRKCTVSAIILAVVKACHMSEIAVYTVVTLFGSLSNGAIYSF